MNMNVSNNSVDQTSATIGGLCTRMDSMENEIADLKADMKTILNILNQARGGWRVILGFCAVVGAAWGVAEVFIKK